MVSVAMMSPGSAQAPPALQLQCTTMGGPKQLEACSALIAAGRGNVAEYFYARGAALLDKRDCDGALADFELGIG